MRRSCSGHNSLRPGSGPRCGPGCGPRCGPSCGPRCRPGCGPWRRLYWPGSSSNRSLRPLRLLNSLSPGRLLIDSSRLRLLDSILLRLLLLTSKSIQSGHSISDDVQLLGSESSSTRLLRKLLLSLLTSTQLSLLLLSLLYLSLLYSLLLITKPRKIWELCLLSSGKLRLLSTPRWLLLEVLWSRKLILSRLLRLLWPCSLRPRTWRLCHGSGRW